MTITYDIEAQTLVNTGIKSILVFQQAESQEREQTYIKMWNNNAAYLFT